MHEARVELTVSAEVPEVEPMGPVEVGVAAEHLLIHVLDLSLEPLRKTGRLAEPVVGVVGHVLRVRQRWWSLERVGWEKVLVEDLAADPSLDVLDVRWGRQVDWVAVRVHPRVRGAAD